MTAQVKVLIIFTLIVISLMGFALYLRNINDAKQLSTVTSTEDVQGSSDFSLYPVVQNIAPTNAYVGLLYRYDLGVMDSDTHYSNLAVSIEEGPSWLSVVNLTLSGVPTAFDVETSKVTIKVTDGLHSTFNTFYILVSNPDESE